MGVAIILLSCGPQKITAKETYRYYSKAITLYKKGDYKGAIEYFEKAKEGTPFLSPQQIERLKYLEALAYYKEGDYENAILSFEDYIFLYPTAPNIQKAYVYLIKAYLKIAPDPWRDPTYVKKAIELAQKFLQRFPDSPYRGEVESLLLQARKRLVKHYYLIAKFYEDYYMYYPAAVRFEYLLLTYPRQIDRRDVLFHYIKNLYLTPRYARKKEKYWHEKYKELAKKIKKGKVSDKKAAQKRLEFYKEQELRWKKIADRAVKTADENLKIYKEKYGEDKNYKLLLKIKEGKWKPSWIERLL